MRGGRRGDRADPRKPDGPISRFIRRLGPLPEVLRRTDVALLHAGLLEDVLGITPEAQAAKTNLWYPQDASSRRSPELRGHGDERRRRPLPDERDPRRRRPRRRRGGPRDAAEEHLLLSKGLDRPRDPHARPLAPRACRRVERFVEIEIGAGLSSPPTFTGPNAETRNGARNANRQRSRPAVLAGALLAGVAVEPCLLSIGNTRRRPRQREGDGTSLILKTRGPDVGKEGASPEARRRGSSVR